MDNLEYAENKILNDYYDEQDQEEFDEEERENDRLSYLDRKAVDRLLEENRY